MGRLWQTWDSGILLQEYLASARYVTPPFSGPPGSQHHAYPHAHGGYRPSHLFYAALQYQGYTSQGYSGRVDKPLLESVRAESALEPPVRNMTLRVIVDGRMKAVPVVPWGGREVVSIGDVFDALQAALPEYLRGGGRDEAQRLRRLADLIADNDLWGGI
ncbi:hypothetical protein DXG01_010340 [Tephrocybe rancida]|nr:hypothetical protein DXG01_010340 [Tephrocybe rancida]